MLINSGKSKTYLFEFSYGKRTEETKFITDILNTFNENTLTGVTIFVNDNIYNLEFLLLLVFEKENEKFDDWMLSKYPKKNLNFKFNYSTSDIIKDQLIHKKYSSYSFSNVEQLKSILTENSNKFFLFPELKILEEKWGNSQKSKKSNVFLSHSSIDKPVVEKIFLELQKEELNVWFDKYEIDYGDSISDKINEGLNNSILGLICLSKGFLRSNWAKSEMNFFIQQRINKGNANFICLILDIEHSEIPPLLQDYRYITLKDKNWFSQLINSIKKKDLV